MSSAAAALFFGRHGCSLSEALYQEMRGFGWNVSGCWSRNPGEALPEDALWWRGDYIICFRSLFILPQALLERAGEATINFHPGPPEYRGIGCLNAALYDGAASYGATCHHMTPDIDGGEIVAVERFPIYPRDNVASLLSRTHRKCHNLASDIIGGIFLEGSGYLQARAAVNSEAWSGELHTRGSLDQQQRLSADIEAGELERRRRAYHTAAHPLVLDLHGMTFRLCDNSEPTKSRPPSAWNGN